MSPRQGGPTKGTDKHRVAPNRKRGGWRAEVAGCLPPRLNSKSAREPPKIRKSPQPSEVLPICLPVPVTLLTPIAASKANSARTPCAPSKPALLREWTNTNTSVLGDSHAAAKKNNKEVEPSVPFRFHCRGRDKGICRIFQFGYSSRFSGFNLARSKTWTYAGRDLWLPFSSHSPTRTIRAKGIVHAHSSAGALRTCVRVGGVAGAKPRRHRPRSRQRQAPSWLPHPRAYRPRLRERSEGAWKGEDLLKVLLEHPATARLLAMRLCEQVFGERALDKSELDALADLLRRNNLRIGRAIETILRSRAFFAEKNLRTRVLRRVEDAAGARALGKMEPPPSTLALVDWMALLGQDRLYPPNVFGWPAGVGSIRAMVFESIFCILPAFSSARNSG